jgi:flagellar biosynthesis/type III secretory pathway chaperone
MRKSLIVAALHLADVLDRENGALKAMDVRQVAGLLPEKTAAIAELIAAGGTIPVPSDPTLVWAARRLDGLTVENRTLLERAIAAQQRVIAIVARAAASAVREPSYGAEGRFADTARPMALSTRA